MTGGGDAAAVLASATTFLVVDWPTREVPEALARAGYEVVVRGGPAPEDHAAFEVVDGEVVRRPLGRPPERVDVVYAFRPLGELPGIVETAVAAGAGAVWIQSGRDAAGARDPKGCWLPEADAAQARAVVEAAGLVYVDQPFIADAVRDRPAGAM